MADQKPWAVVPIDAASAVVVPTPPPAPPEQPFRLRPELYGKNRRLVLVRVIATYTGAVVVGGLISELQFPLTRSSLLFMLTYYLPVFAAVLAFMAWRRVIALKRRYYSIRVWIDDSGVRQEWTGRPLVDIPRDEITECLEIQGKGTMVKTASARRFIWIGDELDGYGFTLQKFREWGKLVPDSELPLLLRPFASFAIAMGMLAILFLSSNPFIVTAGGIVLLGAMGWQIYVCAFGSSADKQVRRQVWSASLSAVIVLARITYIWLR